MVRKASPEKASGAAPRKRTANIRTRKLSKKSIVFGSLIGAMILAVSIIGPGLVVRGITASEGVELKHWQPLIESTLTDSDFTNDYILEQVHYPDEDDRRGYYDDDTWDMSWSGNNYITEGLIINQGEDIKVYSWATLDEVWEISDYQLVNPTRTGSGDGILVYNRHGIGIVDPWDGEIIRSTHADDITYLVRHESDIISVAVENNARLIVRSHAYEDLTYLWSQTLYTDSEYGYSYYGDDLSNEPYCWVDGDVLFVQYYTQRTSLAMVHLETGDVLVNEEVANYNPSGFPYYMGAYRTMDGVIFSSEAGLRYVADSKNESYSVHQPQEDLTSVPVLNGNKAIVSYAFAERNREDYQFEFRTTEFAIVDLITGSVMPLDGIDGMGAPHWGVPTYEGARFLTANGIVDVHLNGGVKVVKGPYLGLYAVISQAHDGMIPYWINGSIYGLLDQATLETKFEFGVSSYIENNEDFFYEDIYGEYDNGYEKFDPYSRDRDNEYEKHTTNWINMAFDSERIIFESYTNYIGSAVHTFVHKDQATPYIATKDAYVALWSISEVYESESREMTYHENKQDLSYDCYVFRCYNNLAWDNTTVTFIASISYMSTFGWTSYKLLGTDTFIPSRNGLDEFFVLYSSNVNFRIKVEVVSGDLEKDSDNNGLAIEYEANRVW